MSGRYLLESDCVIGEEKIASLIGIHRENGMWPKKCEHFFQCHAVGIAEKSPTCKINVLKTIKYKINHMKWRVVHNMVTVQSSHVLVGHSPIIIIVEH